MFKKFEFAIIFIILKMDTSAGHCEICGEQHFYEKCDYILITNHVPDSEVPPRAKLSLPTCFELKKLADESYSIFAKEDIKKGTQFGPLKARKQFTLDPFIKFPIKLFSKSDVDVTEYYLDTSNVNECNWMMFVDSASFVEEQNLICYQVNEEIYFGSVCDITSGECLKVWYSPFYASKMQKQMLQSSKVNIEVTESQSQDIDVNTLVIKQHNILPREIWNCKFCYALEKDIVKFAEHLIAHYRLFLKNTCEICNAKFLYKRSLKKHMDYVHNKRIAPNIINIVNPETKTSEPPGTKRLAEQKDTSLGGPLLMNNIISDSLDNASCIFQQPELSNFDIENQNILFETDNLLSVDVLNERNIENLNSQINDSAQQICDLCFKPFNTVKGLVRHLQLHTGKHICQYCSKVFCRKESLLQHGCVSFPQVKCVHCPKTFATKKMYEKHKRAIHNKAHTCNKCNKTFWDNYYLSSHNCISVSDREKKKFKCQMCAKEFVTLKYLKEHQKTHQSQNMLSSFICHICSKSLGNKRSYVQHLRLHEEPLLSCDSCDKKFHQSDSLTKHKLAFHTSEELQPCNICSLSFKSKRSLSKHKVIHSNKTWTCDICQETFKCKSNLSRHAKRFHATKKSEYPFVCPLCQKELKLRSSYRRHLKKMHPEDCDSLSKDIKSVSKKTNDSDEDFDLDKSIDTDQKCRDLKETIDNMNFTVDINACNGNMDGSETIDRFLKETTKEISISDITRDDKFLKENSTKLNEMSEASSVVADREVHLSVPDLSQTDAEIKLGSNAYILENGTIVEPQENPSNVVVYILNESSVPLKDLVDEIL